MTRPAISGVAIDTLLFSRIGVPLFHRYRIISRSGTHWAFRGSYMRRLHAFLEESDAMSLRRRHRWCAQERAARMSPTSLRDTEDRTADVSPQPNLDLALPRFEGLGDGPRQVHRPWKTSAESPASPDTSKVWWTDVGRRLHV